MDTLTGALVAAAVAWVSIVLAAFVPAHWIDATRLRWVGAGSIALIGAAALGVPLAPAVPLAFLGGGVVASLQAQPTAGPPVAKEA